MKRDFTAQPSELRSIKEVINKREKVKTFRSKSTSLATRKYLSHLLFQQIHQPKDTYLVIASISSKRRKYIPLGFFTSEIIKSNLCLIVPDASLFHFGTLSSAMHMA